MARWGYRFFAVLLLLVVLAEGGSAALAQDRHVDVITVDDDITPVVSRYIARSIHAAEQDGAVCLIVQLDTPGGLLTSTWDIVKSILSAEIPVVVYVTPRGGRAASAGVYITYAAHVAAMAPETHIGAATPIGLDNQGQPINLPTDLRQKAIEDSLAQIRALAQARGRNLDWAEKAVREGASATVDEAKTLGVIDLVANDLPDLLAQLDGRTITLASGRQVTLQTAGIASNDRPMTDLDRFLLLITDPTVAYLLLSLGLLGLWIEFSHPGVSLPGVLGGVSVLLGLYALGTLPVNWTGVLLIAMAFVFFGFDVFATSHGVLTTGGLASFIMGSLLLFHSRDPYLRVQLWAIIVVAGFITAIVILILIAIIRRNRRPPASGPETMIGATGEVRTTLNPSGLIFLQGALWEAWAEGEAILPGEMVEVMERKGLLLYVRRRPGAPPQEVGQV